MEFEHLIRQLFEMIGVKSWVTQASLDGGVDGLAISADPILGGLCVIQAKRYSRMVGLEAVHALAGVVADKRAVKGILITISCPAARSAASRTRRLQALIVPELDPVSMRLDRARNWLPSPRDWPVQYLACVFTLVGRHGPEV